MGGMLSEPETEKKTHHGEGLGLRYGISSMQGWRPEMEDAHDVKIGLKYGLNDWSFFAVFDGHAGKSAAVYASELLLEYILRDKQFQLGNFANVKWPKTSIQEENTILLRESEDEEDYMYGVQGYVENGDEKKTDSNRFEPSPRSEHSTDGVDSDSKSEHNELTERVDLKDEESEAKFISSPISDQLAMVENAIKSGFLKIDQSLRVAAQDASGCTAVCALVSPTHIFIANCGDSRAVFFSATNLSFVTEDHKPFNPTERKRIIDAGGTATQRINGTLAVSRALGDFEFKKDVLRGPCEQLVSPEPEVTIIERDPKDEFLVLACDGIWDVMNNDDLCQFIRHKLIIEPDLEKVCSSVLDLCLNKGSRDNMSIIIVVFETAPKVSESEIERDKKNDEALTEYADTYLANLDKDSSTMDFEAFLFKMKTLLENHSSITLPPGAGIEAKQDLLRQIFEKKLGIQEVVHE